MAPLRKRLPAALEGADAASLQRAVAEESIRRARLFIRGIRAWQAHPARREEGLEASVVARAGGVCLRDYGQQTGAPPVLVVPSLVNRFSILDLAPDHSLLRFLAARGLRPLVVDWGTPGPEERTLGLGDVVTERLAPLLDQTLRLANVGRCAVLGYCMGGTLATALAAIRPEVVKALALLAAPWDFSADRARLEGLPERLEPFLEEHGGLPVDVLQALFALAQPTQVMAKFARFATLDPASPEARLFALAEDWLNDGVPLAAPVARDCLRDWYLENKPARGAWTVGGCAVEPERFAFPALVVVPCRDRVVAPDSARALAARIPDASLFEPMMGHIGLLASRSAPETVWTPLGLWLRLHA